MIIHTEEYVANTQTLIAEVYSAFNQRNIDGALALMRESVSWPKASEGGRVVGKEEIRAYWSRQWKEFDPNVEPIEVIDRGAGKIDVRVHQLVKSLGGDVLSDSVVWHAYTIADGRIERMDLGRSDLRVRLGGSIAQSRPADINFYACSSRRRIRLQADVIIDRIVKALLAPEVSLRRLN